MKRKPQSKRKDKERRIAEAIVRKMFPKAHKIDRVKLIMADGFEWELAGWSRETAISLILRKLRGAK